MAKQAQPLASPNVTFTPTELQRVIAQAIAEHDASKAQKAVADSSAEMDRLCTRAFLKAGFKAEDIKPRENVRTYNLWLQAGYRVKSGEQSVRCKSLRLFHASQVEKLNAVEAKKALAELEQKKAKRAASSDRLPVVSPLPDATPRKATKVLIAEGNA
jgi:hypothetical protein